MTDTIHVKPERKFITVVFDGLYGRGVMSEGENVIVGMMTNEVGIDLTMTREEAKTLAERLLEAAKGG